MQGKRHEQRLSIDTWMGQQIVYVGKQQTDGCEMPAEWWAMDCRFEGGPAQLKQDAGLVWADIGCIFLAW